MSYVTYLKMNLQYRDPFMLLIRQWVRTRTDSQNLTSSSSSSLRWWTTAEASRLKQQCPGSVSVLIGKCQYCILTDNKQRCFHLDYPVKVRAHSDSDCSLLLIQGQLTNFPGTTTTATFQWRSHGKAWVGLCPLILFLGPPKKNIEKKRRKKSI